MLKVSPSVGCSNTIESSRVVVTQTLFLLTLSALMMKTDSGRVHFSAGASSHAALRCSDFWSTWKPWKAFQATQMMMALRASATSTRHMTFYVNAVVVVEVAGNES